MISYPGGEDERMAALRGSAGTGSDHVGEDRSAAQVLADRVAAALVHHEPGWRLPRRSALARRYGVSPAEMEAAIEELAARHLLRRLPDGQVYRASPADYLIKLEGLPDLRATVDPMGTAIESASRHVSWRRVPEDIGGILGLSPGDPVCVVRCLWTSDRCPVAYSATYLPERYAFLAKDPPALADVLRASQVLSGPAGHPPDQHAGRASPQASEDHYASPSAADAGHAMPPAAGAGHPSPPAADAGRASLPDADASHVSPLAETRRLPASVPRPAGLFVELQPPAPSIARSLRLAAGQPAVNVTVRFDDTSAGTPMALATAVLRPEMFRVVIESASGPGLTSTAAGDDGAWPRAAASCEP